MVKNVTVNDALVIWDDFKKLHSMDLEFPIGVSYKIIKLCNELDSLCTYILSRIREVWPDINGGGEMTEEEKQAYDSILLSTVGIDNYGLSVDELVQGNVRIKTCSLEKIMHILD